MGLDTSHNAYHGPYSSFMDFRKSLASHLGFNLLDMEGFGGSKKWDGKDDVQILLSHSDCDGIITPDDCLRLSVRLDQILETLEPSDSWFSLYHFVKKFSDGCKLAYSRQEDIDFH